MSKKCYGLPYLGSKNAIAQWIVDELPEANILYDIFLGGGAITHCAIESGKWEHIVCNDIQQGLPDFFMECLRGEHSIEKHKEWISREEFFARKDSDWYIKLCWSFGNNGKNYIYGKNIEGYKKDVWQAIVNRDYEGLESYGFDCAGFDAIEGIADRMYYFRHSVLAKFPFIEKRGSYYYIKDSEFKSFAQIEQIQSLEHTKRLNTITSTEKITTYNDSYDVIPIIDEVSVIYCDIPYKCTDCRMYAGFDHEKFYEWARKKDNVWVSEYVMPDDFIVVAEREKTVLSSNKGSGIKATERLFVSKKTYDRWYNV